MESSTMNSNSVKTHNNKVLGLVFTLRGKNRRKIYQILLSDQWTLSEISKKTEIPITNVSRVIKQFEEMKIVKNLTPTERIGCLYELTPLGKSFKNEFLKHNAFRYKK